MTQNNLRDQDLRHLWHPYTDPVTFANEPYTCIERGEGAYLYTQDGRALLDGIASWWCVALGHSHPKLLAAMKAQADTLQHSILGNMSHPKAVEVATRIAALCPGDLNRVYIAADGSSATEAALKMTVQYWRNKGEHQRTRFVGLAEGYHGDTLGAMGAGFVSWFHEPFEALVQPALRAPSPHCKSSDVDEQEVHAAKAADALEAILDKEHNSVAAMILEPRIQGAAGIWMYPASYLKRVRELCDHYGILLIADEIAVGFGRTGAIFACDTAAITPDILCIGKCLTGGYLPMSAAVASDRIFEAFETAPEVSQRIFWDGHTYCGNPITSALAIAAMDVYEEQNFPASCQVHEQMIADAFREVGTRACVEYQQSLGMVGMCVVKESAGGAQRARNISLKANDLGLFIRPLGTSLYLWPPLTATTEELQAMVHKFMEAVDIAEA